MYRSFPATTLAVFLLLRIVPSALADSIPENKANYVLFIVVDGLRGDAVPREPGDMPNYARLRREGAYTENARIDYESSQTLPGHICAFSGQTVDEHGFTRDKWDGSQRLSPSLDDNIFNLVSDQLGETTCMYAAKSKFGIFPHSWKIDKYVYSKKLDSVMTQQYINEMKGSDPCKVAFLHWRDPDRAGHKRKGVMSDYWEAVRDTDDYLKLIFDLVDNTSHLKDKTAIILSSDHGFEDINHGNEKSPEVYTIPFYVWGPCVDAGADLYSLNRNTRKDPQGTRPSNSAIPQPIGSMMLPSWRATSLV